MLLVKTYLDKSPVHGVGVFAGEDIPQGTLVWEFNPLIDIVLTPEQVAGLPETVRKFVDNYSVCYPFGTDNYCMSLDNSQYMNHSDTPNLECSTSPERYGDFAAQDIPKGTELTIDYYLEDQRTTEADIS